MSTPLGSLAVTLDSYREELDRLADVVRPLWRGNGHDLPAALRVVEGAHFDPRMRHLASVALQRVDVRWVAEAFEAVLAG